LLLQLLLLLLLLMLMLLLLPRPVAEAGRAPLHPLLLLLLSVAAAPELRHNLVTGLILSQVVNGGVTKCRG
jgi:hypothetical protein